MERPEPPTRRPRGTIRLRLTLLYGGLFLASGVGLLVVTYVLVQSAGFLVLRTDPGGAPNLLGGSPGRFGLPTGTDMEEMHDAFGREFLLRSGIALALMAVVSTGLGWVVAGRVLRPLRTITTTTRQISATNLHQRLGLVGPEDELKELGDTVDGLLARLERAFEAQRRFAANASHELRTPLARQRTLLEVALADPTPTLASLQAACRRALAAGEQQERLIEALLTLASGQRGLDTHEPVDLAAIARDALEQRRSELERRGLELTANVDPVELTGDARLTERLVANLLDNAMRHNVAGGWLTVLVGTRDGHPVVAVSNSGREIAPHEVEGLFQPFRRIGGDRTADRGGAGLGLSIVSAIAQAHGAAVYARALPRGGLDVEVRFTGGDGPDGREARDPAHRVPASVD